MLEDVYDLLALLVNAASRTGSIGEEVHKAAHELIARVDPKIEQKRQAAEAAAQQAQAEYQEFLAYKAYKQQAEAAQAAPPAGPAPVFQPPAGGFGAPVVAPPPAVPAVPGG